MYEAGKIRLRPLERSDLQLVHELENDQFGTFYSRGIVINFKNMDEVIKEYEEDLKGHRKRFIVEEVENKRSVGIASIYDNPGPLKRAGIGLYTKKEYWNSGFGKVATFILLEILFYFLDYEKVEAWSAEYNKRAHKVLMENGLIVEGRIRRGLKVAGKYYDWLIFGILKEEYFEKRNEIIKKVLRDSGNEYLEKLKTFNP